MSDTLVSIKILKSWLQLGTRYREYFKNWVPLGTRYQQSLDTGYRPSLIPLTKTLNNKKLLYQQ